MKIFVAIPVYDGKLQVQTVKCLLEETTIAIGVGDDLRVNFLPSCSVPAQGRNQLVQMFLESDCDRLFFLDSDLTFEPGSIIKTCHMPADFVGGCYRFKSSDEKYPINWLSEMRGIPLGDKTALLEVGMLPTGFLALSRKVFDSFKKHYPDREYEHWGAKAYGYFQMAFKDGALYSDDSYFCKEWIQMGGKIYLDPEIELAHWDSNPTPYSGRIGNWLKRINGIPLSPDAPMSDGRPQ